MSNAELSFKIQGLIIQAFPSLSEQTVRDELTRNESIIDAFLNGNEPHKLIFTVDQPNMGGAASESGDSQAFGSVASHSDEQMPVAANAKIHLSNPQDEEQAGVALNGWAMYFVRLSDQPVPKKVQLWSDYVISGVLSSESIEGLHALLSYVYAPIFETQEDWRGKTSHAQAKEFLSSISRFSERLSHIVASQTPEITLREPDSKYATANVPKSIIASRGNKVMVAHFDEVVNQWIVDVRSLLSETNDDASDPGPKSEIEFWKARYAKLTSIQEQLKENINRVAIGVLRAARSRVSKEWKAVDIEITDAINEAKDNVKYLSTLEKYIDPLYNGNPLQIIDILPGLLKNIGMMHSIARYYNTTDRMTELFVKITNQMIVNCKNTINDRGPLWEQDTQQLIDNLKLCIRLNDEYQRCYRLERDKLSRQPQGKQFSFDYLKIFGKFELFCSRIQTLIELFSTIEQFKALKRHNIDGMETNIEKFFVYVEELRRKSSDLLDYTKNAFDKDYMQFNKKIAHLEQSLQVFINTSFEYITSSEHALNLLKRFQSILQRDSLKNELDNKYTVIFHNYGIQLDNVQKIYANHCKDPPMVRNAPQVAGNIIWARQLMRRIEEPMKKFQQIPAIMNSKESKKIIKTYNKVLRALFKFETMWLQTWRQTIERAKDGLSATILVKVNNQYFVNFDREILKLLRETKWLMRLGVQVPSSASIVLLQENKFKSYLNRLTHLLNEYARITKQVHPVTADLLAPNMAAVERSLARGRIDLSWTSTGVDEFIFSAEKTLSVFEQLVSKINNIIENRIENNLRQITENLLVSLPQETFSSENFVESQRKHIKSQQKKLMIKNAEVEQSVHDIIQIIRDYGDSVDEQAVKKLYAHFESRILNALVSTTTRSLYAIRWRVASRNKKGYFEIPKPFFSVNVELIVPEISLSPSLEEVQESINRAVKQILQCSNALPRWSYISEGSENPPSFFDEVAKDITLVKVIMLLNGGIHGLKKQVDSYLSNFSRYEYLWTEDKHEAYKKFIAACNNKPTLEDFEIELKKYLDIEREIKLITSSYTVGCLSLSTSRLKSSLKELARSWKSQYAKNLHNNAKHLLEKIVNEIDESSKKLGQNIDTLENLKFVMEVLKDIREKSSMIDYRFRKVSDRYNILQNYGVEVPKEEQDKVYDLPYKWSKLTKIANDVNDKIARVQSSFKKKLVRAVSDFKVDVVQFRNEFVSHGPMVSNIEPQEAMERLKKYERLYAERKRRFETYLAGENLFGLPQSAYPELEQTEKELGFLKRLYSLYIEVIKKVSGYEDILWLELDFQAITSEVDKFAASCRNLPKQLRTWQAYLKLKKTIDDFLELQPLLEKLSDDSMRPRHWEHIEDKVGKKFKQSDESFKLKHIMEANILEFKEEIEEISISARKEADIERKVNQIAEEWRAQELTFAEHQHRGFIILKGQETAELMESLEDTQMTVGSLMGSRYVGPFREVVQTWMTKLTSIIEVLEQWMTVQAMWMYMEAVFRSGDISKQLPASAKKFASIDKNWIKIMMKANAQANVINFCYDNEMLNNLPYLKEQLEECQKSLTGYLGQKRNIFPRFYFNSDPVLLEILSQSSDPTSIQPHLSQIFDSIHHVTFDDRVENKITHMHDSSGEVVKFTEPFIAEGNVEEWLQKLEVTMQKTMRDIIRNCARECSSITMEQLISEYPAQVALLGIQLLWTADCEDAINKYPQDKKALVNNGMKIERIVRELSEMTTRELSPQDRIKIETLITVQVHQRDVFRDSIKNKKISNVKKFEWQRQARFYWRTDRDTCIIFIADIDNEYCYEYLGCKERLVITPLTDRCYITLSQALGLKLGGAPAGPAGTGKTETVKDLGRTLGKYVIVFNCSDQMDYRAMAKIYKGIAQSGAWGDFDEFNRIELEVLSVVAQQISCILTAMRDMAKKFTFTDGTACKLDMGLGIFITMNPGYQGRVELPENLKVLFRGVAMMVPDKRIIIDVKLASCGYNNTTELSKKFFILYRLCEQQLSKQPHYDFGLRNILSVLRTAGSTKRKEPKSGETYLLYRTLRDMNTSKLVQEDVELFLNLIQDLFPGTQAEKRTYPELEARIEHHLKVQQLVKHQLWFEKVIQLYETSLVRHGIMVVGPSGAGKSTCYSILLAALSDLKPVHKEFRMNPKAITANQMFGKLDIIQNEWTDGIFSALFKIAAKQSKQNIWIICDGPVDAIWIENLNTVLDDNKLLTLANGDRIGMSPSMKMCFEVENLNNASPATVSRAGQIYMSETVLGWEPVISSKLMGKSVKGEIVKAFTEAESVIVKKLFDDNIDQGLKFIEKNCEAVMQVCSMNLVVTCFDLLYSLTNEHRGRDVSKSIDNLLLEKLFIFCYAWSLGGVLESADRKKFSAFVSERFPNTSPQNTNIYDSFIAPRTGEWTNWKQQVPDWEYPGDEELEFSTLYVPTADSVRTEYLIQKIHQQNKDVLLIGGTGTAKTVTVEHYVGQLNAEKMAFKKINFSSATSPNLFQNSIESVVEKRFRAFGPPGGKKMTVFIDDINMPEINEWGDQITNEMVRQLVESNGFYSLSKPGDWIQIEDLHFIAAMSHPGGGKNDIPARLKRHFSIFNVTLPAQTSIDQMFGSILSGKFNSRRFGSTVVKIAQQMTPATIRFWKLIQRAMLPTPKKFHYVFNLRDLSRVYQGVLLCPAEIVRDDRVLVDLWKHECTRVFSDRLNDVKDKIWFDNTMADLTKEFFGENYVESKTYFANFLRDPIIDEDTEEIIEEAPKIYEPVKDLDWLRDKVYSYMKRYNDNTKVRQLDLVLFNAAIKHLVRISRIISMPRGNALLVGVGGSGKQSLTRLASFIAGYVTRQIALTKTYNEKDFFEDLRDLYKTAGALGKSVTFIFTDNDIKQETFLEYINSILSSGEVSGLFTKDDLDPIINDLRDVAKREYPKTIGKNDTWDNLYKFFIQRVRDNLHIVLCFSPVGDRFRNRALKFPGLISGSNINWFFPWPEDALVSVANKFLNDYKVESTAEVKQSLIHHMASIHLSMNAVSQRYFERFRRHVYTTPKSYLSFIELYKDVYQSKYDEINAKMQKVNGGLDVLQRAAEDVEELKLKLADKEARLSNAQKETAEMLENISHQTEEAQKRKDDVEVIRNKLLKDKEVIMKGKAEAETELNKAKPALDKAVQALSSITSKDIAFIRNLANPPFLVKLVLDGVLLLRLFPINKVHTMTDKNGIKVIKDSWDKSKRMMNQPGFLRALLSFEKDSINDETIELLQPYLEHPSFNPVKTKEVSEAAAGLCTWINAMETYTVVAKDVKPKMARLRESENKLAVASAKLQAKEDELANVEGALNEVRAKFDAAIKKKEDLEQDAIETRRFMEQANNLIDALGGERGRWTKESTEFQNRIDRLVGDCALACAFISYCGPFNSEFRNVLLNEYFYRDCVKRSIPVTKNLKVTNLLTDESQIGEWSLQGLPSDEHSIQNAIMLTRSSKWSLLVDPQGQGSAWLKKRELESNNLVVVRMSENRFSQKLENAMAFGQTLIIENIDEDLDPILDPILEKNIVKIGSISQIMMSGNESKDYDTNFKLYLTTNLPNPHFSPELYAKTTIIDFTVTMKGLEQQLLGYVIQKEKAELEERREALLADVTANQKRIKVFEERLLEKLSNTKDLLGDRDLIKVLASTKKASAEVQEKLNVAKETELRINSAREEYRPVAIRGSVLYFLVVEMSEVNPMYQTSLKQFLRLFERAIGEAEKAPLASKRIKNIIDRSTWTIFEYMSIGLFKRHKFLFVLLLACKILLRDDAIKAEEFSCLLKGGAALDIKTETKTIEWLSDTVFLNVLALSRSVPVFANLPKMMHNKQKLWQMFYEEEKLEQSNIPEFNDKLSAFERLLLIRSLREDRTIVAAYDFIKSTLSAQYTDTIPVDLESIWKSSHCAVPLICLLSPGNDPTSMIESLAKKQKKEIEFISMGQGQEVKAQELINNGFENGNWVLLQNCHLGLKFIATLEDTLTEQYKESNIHSDFRLWITSEPNPKFPIGLLQMSIKLTLEGDVGLKASMKSSFQWVNQDMLDASKRPEWRPLLYTICFLNSIVAERRKFGPLGWNVPYEFNYADLTASLAFLQNHFASIGDKSSPISWDTIHYMICEVHYGGKITDDFDRRLFSTFGDIWLNPQVKNDDFFFLHDRYKIPQGETMQSYLQYIEDLPSIDPPEVFGLHPNADITYREQEARMVLSTILDVQPKSSTVGTGLTREEIVMKIVKKRLKQLPKDFKPDDVKDNIKRLGGKRNSLNVFLAQEIDRLQRLLSVVRRAMLDIQLAIDGTIIMSSELEEALTSLFDARVPPKWLKLSWDSPTLGQWFDGFFKRHEQLHQWLTTTPPNSYWLTGFYNPQGFLTAVHQEVTRKSKGTSLDDAVLKTEVTTYNEKNVDAPRDGVYIHGLYLEGAGWNTGKCKLRESNPKVLLEKMPVIHITATSQKAAKKNNTYACPVYRHQDRTDYNFIFDIPLNCAEKSSHWIVRGVAMFTR
uniref:AAA+ ATPase domain-containing protein n=1 Tax=Percolomonas cosmopolitus TaxID=63605 RepID=A0A7S1PHU2_9EUKA|mmetsp:Transcript_2558/g.9708  ORF Transcript_2558/g.9708 Transcript_2558/m.9708 type:complete len:4497 (+) Transcript_2558:392-13882(+)